MWEIIRKNKIKSVIALFVMTVWCTVIYGLIFTILLICLLSPDKYSDFFIYFPIGCLIVLLIFSIRFLIIKDKPYNINSFTISPANKIKNKQLYNLVEEITIASGANIKPKLYILNSDILNAYACGLKPEQSSIVISKGLLKILSREELQGVIAHEMSHIINRDTTYLLCSGILFAISATISTFLLQGARGRGKGAAACLLLFLISILGQLICFLLFMFISRRREYLADACASQYTRYPKGLADALLKIEKGYSKEIIEPDNLVKASFIVPLAKKEEFFSEIKSTHPLTQNRIKVLLNMTSADFREYEKQFEKLNNKKILPKSALNNSETIEIKKVEEIFEPDALVLGACALNSAVKNEQIKTIKENKEILNKNIQKHREIENLVHDLEGYEIIECDCKTILKIPPVYKNTMIICPHCRKKHAIKN